MRRTGLLEAWRRRPFARPAGTLIRRPPAPLAALLAAVALVGVAWALFVPPFQVPDEGSHLAYVQNLARELKRPAAVPPRTPPVFSGELWAALNVSRGRWFVGGNDIKSVFSGAPERRYAAATRRLAPGAHQRVSNASNQANDPPLYYAYEALPYRLSGGNLFDRLFAMRLWSVLLLLVTTLGAWLLAGELTGRDRVLQLVGAGCVGLQPMVTFMSGAVNPDAAVYALSAIVLWLGVRLLRRGPTLLGVVSLLAALLAGGLVKSGLLTLGPAVAVAAIVSVRRARAAGSGWKLAPWQVATASALVLAGGLAASRHVFDNLPRAAELRGLASYVWQFYLPRLPFQAPVPGIDPFGVYHVWLIGSWGDFGWLDVVFPRAVYLLLGCVSIGAFAGAAVALRRRRVRVDPAVIAFFAIAIACLLVALHLSEWHSLVQGGGARNQGRYLLPLLPIAGTAMAVALTNLRPARRAPAAALVMGGMAALQLFSLAIVAGRFYV
ncbi:MAG: hypothetical protein QOD53_1137 [Thermoleophilaceae bacterium]|nr:hypothetical protein [Thermoleophilaceae bacterium]